ncbi:hypothetical protein HUO13_28645 [Saccharopolyspora erythraea]|nr:hypothetical protein HUO13_28645 [Saccharopolyspora erythraea]
MEEPETCALLEFWAALHDIGKVTPSFARQVAMAADFPADVGGVRVRHERATHLWLPSGLEPWGYSRGHAWSVGRVRCPEFGGGPEARMIVLADGRSKVRWLLRRSTPTNCVSVRCVRWPSPAGRSRMSLVISVSTPRRCVIGSGRPRPTAVNAPIEPRPARKTS